jgi:hypothetical protein
MHCEELACLLHVDVHSIERLESIGDQKMVGTVGQLHLFPLLVNTGLSLEHAFIYII